MEKNKSNDSIWDKTRGDKNGTISKKELKEKGRNRMYSMCNSAT